MHSFWPGETQETTNFGFYTGKERTRTIHPEQNVRKGEQLWTVLGNFTALQSFLHSHHKNSQVSTMKASLESSKSSHLYFTDREMETRKMK